jgi:hypothetical protein
MLNTELNILAPDDFYEELVELHRDLSDEQSALVNAKLILVLANHIGDPAVLREAMRAAREDVGGSGLSSGQAKDSRNAHPTVAGLGPA